MTRALVLLLVLANVTYFAWTRGALKPWGLAPAARTEPQRTQDQIEPAAVRLLPSASAPASAPAAVPAVPPTNGTPGNGAAPASGAPAPPVSVGISTAVTAPPGECLQAGPFTDTQWAGLQDVLRTSLPTTVWTVENLVEPARWIVYMGRYADAEAVRRKRGELSVLKVATEALSNPALEPGLSLGAHGTEEEARAALEALGRRGVRTARVLRERAEVRSHVVRVPGVDPVLKPQLDSLRPLLAGKVFQPCTGPATHTPARPT
jgi:hypothetical protein